MGGTTIDVMVTLSVTDAASRLHELARSAQDQHERYTLTDDGQPRAVLLSIDELESLEATLEVLGDAESVASIAESLAERARGEQPTDLETVRQEFLARTAPAAE